MLIGIPKLLSPELLKILCEMGHGDKLVIADGNFPAASCAQRLIRLDGHDAQSVLEAILKVFPVDGEPQVLQVMQTDDGHIPEIWRAYTGAFKSPVITEEIERFRFYDLAREAYCVVATSEAALYANLILTKGVI
ncbi:MAG: L-fucose mutarotase [Clostridiales bacterium]|jgi:L-fucose mutarotase|nr:L-fucose mutarotase [Clostridiales bacterium]